MKRRRYLLGCAGLLAGLAGCPGGADPAETPTGTSEPTPTPEATATATPTATESPTPTATPTASPTPTPTATANPNVFVHELNTRFTVGGDRRPVTYRVIRYRRADSLGSAMNRTEARGTFLVVYAELTNPGETLVAVPWDDFRVRSQTTWHKFDEEATERIDTDDRIEEPSLARMGVQPGESITGAVAFDVDPESAYRVWVTPINAPDTPSHYVPIGDIQAVEELSR